MISSTLIEVKIRYSLTVVAYISVKQILFVHLFFFCAIVLLKALYGAFVEFIDYKRTPLIVYKDGYDHQPPAPNYPAPHKEYGYTGGFKEPAGHHKTFVHQNAPIKHGKKHGKKVVHHGKTPSSSYVSYAKKHWGRIGNIIDIYLLFIFIQDFNNNYEAGDDIDKQQLKCLNELSG